MFDFGVEGYEPRWLRGRGVVAREHGQRFWKLDEVSLTWNTIDPGRQVRRPGFDLEWRAEPLPGLAAARGLPLDRVELLAWTGKDAAEGNVDVSFVFPDARVTVFNALDENGIGFAPPSPHQRPHAPG